MTHPLRRRPKLGFDGPIEAMLWGVLILAALGLRVAAWQNRAGLATFRSMLDTTMYRQVAERISAGHLVGDHAFFMSPAYPYLMAWCGDTGLVLLQILSGVASLTFLAWALRDRMGPVAGLCLLALGGFAAPLVLYDTSLLPDGLATSAVAFGLAALALAPRGRIAAGLAAGCAVALGIALRSNLYLLALGWFLVFVFSLRRRPGPGSARAALAFVLPVLVVAGAIALANHAAEGLWAPRSYNGGLNLYLGNAPNSEGTYTTVNEVHPGDPMGRAAAERRLGPGANTAQVEGYWRSRAWTTMREHPATTARLWGRKLLLSLRSDELPQMEDLSLSRRESWALRAAPVGFGILLLLAVVGVGTGRDRLGGELTTYAAIAVLSALAVCVIFFVNGRLRMPMWPGLLVLAAVGAERLWSLSRQGRWKPAILPLAVGLTLVAVPFGLDVHSTFVRARSAARYAALEALAGHRQQARSWLLYMDALQHRGSAEAKLERTYREKPDSRWILRTEKAAAYYALGEYRRAYEELRAVVRARPDFLRAQRGLYDVCSKLLAAGETDPAVRAARDAARARLSRGSGSP